MGSCASTADPKSAQQKPSSKEEGAGGAGPASKKPLRFSYFPVHNSGLGILLTLEAHALPWDANSVGFDAWGPMKATGAAPFDRLPILETDDAGTIAETLAILRYLGRRTDSEGKDELEKVRGGMLMGFVEEMRADHKFVQPTVLDKTKSAEKCKEYWEKTLPAHLDKLEKFLDGKDRVTEAGKSPTEFHLWSHLHQLLCLQGGSDSMKEGRPHLHSFYTRIDDLDSTKNVVSGNSLFGGFFPYFLTLEQAAAAPAAADPAAADGEKSAERAAPAAAAADAAPAEATKGEEEEAAAAAAAAAAAPKGEEAKAEGGKEEAAEGQEDEKVVPVEGSGDAAGAGEEAKEESAPAEGAAGGDGTEKTEAEKAEKVEEAKAEEEAKGDEATPTEGKKGEETVVEPVTEIAEENK